MILSRLSLYANAVLLVALILLGALWQYEAARKHKALADCAKAQTKAALQQVADLAGADERARKAEDRLSEVLRRMPKAAPDVREATRNDPSPCVVQPAVRDRVSRAIRESNEGAR